MYKLGFKETGKSEIKLLPFIGLWKMQGNLRKTSTSLTKLRPLTVWITINCGKFLKGLKYQTILPASWETCMQVKKQQLEPDIEQWTGSKLGKKYIKAVYCHPAYLTYMQSTSCQMPGWMKHMLESRLPGEISITSDMHCLENPRDGGAWWATVYGVAKSQTRLSDWTELNCASSSPAFHMMTVYRS